MWRGMNVARLLDFLRVARPAPPPPQTYFRVISTGNLFAVTRYSDTETATDLGVRQPPTGLVSVVRAVFDGGRLRRCGRTGR